jgi:hypothetical protein
VIRRQAGAIRLVCGQEEQKDHHHQRSADDGGHDEMLCR